MGVPVVAFPGARFCARHSTCHLKDVGLDDWISADAKAYVDLAVCRAERIPELAELRLALRETITNSPLMDGTAFARGFTQLLREVWREACAAQ